VLANYEPSIELIGWYVLDNAFNNDTAVELLEGIEDSLKRTHCIGHILHLAIQDCLSDSDSSEKWT